MTFVVVRWNGDGTLPTLPLQSKHHNDTVGRQSKQFARRNLYSNLVKRGWGFQVLAWYYDIILLLPYCAIILMNCHKGSITHQKGCDIID